MKIGVLIGGPQDGREVPIGPLPEYGFDGGISWRDEGRWYFWTEIGEHRYYVYEGDAIPLIVEDDGA